MSAYVCFITVDINPSEMLYFPINTLRNVTCRVEGGAITRWFIILNDGSEESINTLINNMPSIPGITGRLVNGGFSTLEITVNTSNTSVTGLRCEGVDGNAAPVRPAAINVTILGKLCIFYLFVRIKRVSV